MTQLHAAIRAEDTEKALGLINGTIWNFRKTMSYIFGIAVVNAKNWQGQSPLHLVAEYYKNNPAAYKVILEALLKAGANKEATDAHGATPLHIAASNGQIDVVTTLLQAGAATNYYANNMTALGCAAAKGHNKVIKVLFDHKAKLRIDDHLAENPITPMQAAAASGKLATIKLLLQHGGNVNDITRYNQIYCRTPLWYAFDYAFKTTPNDFSIAKFLLTKEADPNQNLSSYRSGHIRVMALNLRMREQVDLIGKEIQLHASNVQRAFIENYAGAMVRYEPQQKQASTKPATPKKALVLA